MSSNANGQRHRSYLQTHAHQEGEHEKFTSMYKDIDPDEARKLKEKNEELERKAIEKDPAKMEESFNKKFRRCSPIFRLNSMRSLRNETSTGRRTRRSE